MKHFAVTLFLINCIAPRCAVAQVEGMLDGTFNVSGIGTNERVYAIVVQPDGKILIGGDFTN
jgi:hypothetical protein